MSRKDKLLNFSVEHSKNRRRLHNKNHSYSNIAKTERVSKKQIDVYGQVFEDIIRQDSIYGGLLSTIKKSYDNFIAQVAPGNPENDSVSEEIKLLQEESAQKEKCIQRLKSEREAILKEFEEAKRTSEETLRKLKDDSRTARIRENRYANTIKSLKDKGYPVEDIYNNHVKTKHSFTGSSSVPKINIPRHQTLGFHEEFMNRLEEFSESWRDQIKRQHSHSKIS